jgi:hypothetical protein
MAAFFMCFSQHPMLTFKQLSLILTNQAGLRSTQKGSGAHLQQAL